MSRVNSCKTSLLLCFDNVLPFDDVTLGKKYWNFLFQCCKNAKVIFIYILVKKKSKINVTQLTIWILFHLLTLLSWNIKGVTSYVLFLQNYEKSIALFFFGVKNVQFPVISLAFVRCVIVRYLVLNR
jgi:hypothetical protein